MLMQRCWNHDPRSRPGAPEVLQVLLTPLVLHSSWRSYTRLFDCVTPCSGPPAWKRLISQPLSTYERIALITTIFSDRGKAEVTEHISGDDAQAFIDVICEVSIHTAVPLKGGLDDSC